MTKRYSEIFPSQVLTLNINEFAKRLNKRTYKSQMINEFIKWARNQKIFKISKYGSLYTIDSVPKKYTIDKIYPSTFLFKNKIIEMSDKDFDIAMKLIGINFKIPVSRYKRKVVMTKQILNNFSKVDKLMDMGLWDGLNFNYELFGNMLNEIEFCPSAYIVTPQLILRIAKLEFS